MDSEALRSISANQSDIILAEAAAQEISIEVEFKCGRVKNGAIIINAENRQEKNPFDLPADKIKRIVRGIIWRDEHFAGATLKDIARTGGHGENYVNRCIEESFEFLSR